MSSLIDKVPAAQAWLEDAFKRCSDEAYGSFVSAVLWTAQKDSTGELIVPVDPIELVRKINTSPFILLNNHDPGKPAGQVLESAYFESEEAECFVVAVLGYYAGGDASTFEELGLEINEEISLPTNLPTFPSDCCIVVATDPREVDEEWLGRVTSSAPIAVERVELSHNAAESAQELIIVGLAFVALVWNPFVKSFASEAGKDTYRLVNSWIKKLCEELSDRMNPVLDIHTHQKGCQVSFLLRGNDRSMHFKAHEELSGAAMKAAELIDRMKSRGTPAQQLVYEFDKETLRWFPSYAILFNNKIITSNTALIALEQIPRGLSLGISRKDMPPKR
ncbi:conserved hypothetical protein [Pseudomonas sp. 9AZ]|uniref:hypothetical protein n=1 Tax=Pseudomonas sp. 9AZ TaxID=2653168 RepID=UPI0012F04FD2|nr:hypothetical protein [Pseudomonas sp. 9AZ]VXC41756.1 conserved hypothetical protein [Pseudomonas sp. 9AZ]